MLKKVSFQAQLLSLYIIYSSDNGCKPDAYIVGSSMRKFNSALELIKDKKNR